MQQSHIPVEWDTHLEGKIDGVVFCQHPQCWCHRDERKWAFVGSAMVNKLIPESQAADIMDGKIAISPELVMVESFPMGWVTPAKEGQHE